MTCRTRRRSPFHGPSLTRLFQRLRKKPWWGAAAAHPCTVQDAVLSFDAGHWCYIALVSKLLRHASIAITADVHGHLVGTIAQKAVDGAANLIARTVHTQQGVDA